MILGATTSHKLQVTYSAAAAVNLKWTGWAVVISTASPPVGDGTNTGPSINAALTNAAGATADLIAGVASTKTRAGGILRNVDASNSNSVTFKQTDGTTTNELATMNLLPGEWAAYDGYRWFHYDSNGALYPSVGNAATQTDMEAGSATNKYVTPQGFNWHPGACKAWGKAVGAGTSLTVNWNISGITDTGTGRLGVTIGTDFSSANYPILAQIERGVTTLAVGDVETCAIRNASPAAGSFEIESYDHTSGTMIADDPANYFWACFGDQ